MKMLIIIATLVSSSAWALDMAELDSRDKGRAQNLIKACKADKVKFCDKYNEMDALKECLIKNRDGLSADCKAELGVR